MFKRISMLAAAVLSMASAASATTLFSDDFNAATQGLNVAPAGWVQSNGTVDVIGTGFFEFYPGNGNYIDMDGSTFDAGRIDTIATFAAFAGSTYSISFDYGVNAANAETLTFGFAGWVGTLLIPAGGIASLTPFTVTFQALTTGNSTLFFEAAGNDNQGPVIDNVSLAAVPLPAGGLLLLGALGGIAALRRRKAA